MTQGPAATQGWLVRALEDRGFVATQSSVSRDLRELGAIKTAVGYELPESQDDDDSQLLAVANLLRSVQTAGSNLLVIHTGIGAAQRVALALDRSGWPGIVGDCRRRHDIRRDGIGARTEEPDCTDRANDPILTGEEM